MDEIVIATGNPHKVEEISAIFSELGPRGVRLRSLKEFDPIPEPAETGTTFEANATIKARWYADRTGCACLADDSGLEVEALGGRPGVISSHYGTDGRETGLTREQRDHANNLRLLRELEGVEPARRAARFVCVMVVAWPTLALAPGAWGVPPHEATQPRLSGSRLSRIERPDATYFITWRLREGTLDPAERRIVLDACLHWHGERAWLHAGVVMPDRVHILLRPIVDAPGASPSELVHSIKSFTAREINTRRGTRGSLWQDDYFEQAYSLGVPNEVVAYLEEHPRNAGLVAPHEHYPFAWREIGHGRLVVAGEDRGVAGGTRGAGRPTLRVIHGTLSARGEMSGRIGEAPSVPRGDHGFGYDPLFLVAPDFLCTGAELSPTEKNAISHRAHAARAMARLLDGAPDPLSPP